MTVPDEIDQFASLIGPRQDDVLLEMQQHAEATEFPTVGSGVGGWLRQLTQLVDAERVFEFGSGFGYSAYWFAGALPSDGEVVLTEIDADELESAREYLARGGYDDRAAFEEGDAIEIADRYDGQFDIALIDNEKHRYVEAFETIRPKIPVGGVVVADNIIEGPFTFGALRKLVLDSESAPETEPESGNEAEIETEIEADTEATDSKAVRGIMAYLDHVESSTAFETTLLPLGEGLAVSRRVR